MCIYVRAYRVGISVRVRARVSVRARARVSARVRARVRARVSARARANARNSLMSRSKQGSALRVRTPMS